MMAQIHLPSSYGIDIGVYQISTGAYMNITMPSTDGLTVHVGGREYISQRSSPVSTSGHNDHINDINDEAAVTYNGFGELESVLWKTVDNKTLQWRYSTSHDTTNDDDCVIAFEVAPTNDAATIDDFVFVLRPRWWWSGTGTIDVYHDPLTNTLSSASDRVATIIITDEWNQRRSDQSTSEWIININNHIF
jgi:hypothetical protein